MAFVVSLGVLFLCAKKFWTDRVVATGIDPDGG
jgi:hypothetical protein